MKITRILSMLALAFLLMPAFVSCDKEDEDKGEPALADAIVGSYTGSIGYSVMGFIPGDIEGEYELKIVKNPNVDDEVTVVLPQCSFTPPIPQSSTFTIPALTIAEVDVTAKGNVYYISEDDISLEDNGTVYSCKLSGKIVGKNAEIEYTVRPGSMPMDIVFTFKGTLK